MGVTIDIDGQGVNVATADDLERHFARLTEWLRDRNEEFPMPLQNSRTTLASPTTYFYVPLGGPKVGWLWDLMRLVINGNDPTASVAGNVWAYIGKPEIDSSTIGQYPELFEVPSVTIPNEAFYTRQQVVIWPGQQLVVAFKSLPASTQVNCSGLAYQYRDPAAGSPVNTYRQPK